VSLISYYNIIINKQPSLITDKVFCITKITLSPVSAQQNNKNNIFLLFIYLLKINLILFVSFCFYKQIPVANCRENGFSNLKN